MEDLQIKIDDFKSKYPISEELKSRIPEPRFEFFGEMVWNMAVHALLCGKNLLLTGEKSTGKNVLAENLAKAFGRPLWNVSFHVNIDQSGLIGTDTLKNGSVVFEEGPIYQVATSGGFGVLDEINMAKNEAAAVLHSILDYRRIIDIPGSEIIKLSPASRFIATMNYGYAGTRELNEALLSRFVVIEMPRMEAKDLVRFLKKEFPLMKGTYADQFAELYSDLIKKSEAGEISSSGVDIRGIVDALDLVNSGLSVKESLDMGLTNKSFDPYERQLIQDAINARLPKGLTRKDIFEGNYV
ncbi:MAG: MoxR family ATPase [Tissierellia bacterium]|nr:MoxR family ATPase [Tissierellia bacterium]